MMRRQVGSKLTLQGGTPHISIHSVDFSQTVITQCSTDHL